MISDEAGPNVRQLQEKGFAIKWPLPEAYEEIIEGLGQDQIDLLISIKERFDRAQAETPAEVGSYAAYILGPIF